MQVMPLTKTYVDVLGRRMAFHQRGDGRSVLFLHGNPTSSYLWRNVVPAVEGLGRLIAPDLIGMGDSDKIAGAGPGTYSFDTHRQYLWAFIDAVAGPGKLVLVVHDWGSVLGFDWACSHPERVEGIAYMEGIVRPLVGWEEWNRDAAPIFQAFRSDAGEGLILERNMFIERVLPGSILRRLDEAEMEEYRRPFRATQDRWPMLTWPRQIPIGGEPADVVTLASNYAAWLARTPIPKLFINAEPGAILTGAARDFCRTWPNQTEVTVAGSHFIQEDSPGPIGQAVAEWIHAALPPAPPG